MPNRRFVLTGFGVFLLGVFAFVLFFYANFRSVEVHGTSMEPTFESGRRLLMSNAFWLVGDIRKDDIVVVKVPDTTDILIKRVKGLPGDVVDFKDVPHSWKLGDGEYKVPEGTLYVVGDNRPVSQDSRDYGPFEPTDILGKVVIFGHEPWLYGMLTLAAATILASGVASAFDAKSRSRRSK